MDKPEADPVPVDDGIEDPNNLFSRRKSKWRKDDTAGMAGGGDLFA